MDEIDRAEKHEQMSRDIAIEAVKMRDIETEKPDEENGIRYCLDCGDEINAQRLIDRPSSVRCVSCKQIREHKAKQYRGRYGF